MKEPHRLKLPPCDTLLQGTVLIQIQIQILVLIQCLSVHHSSELQRLKPSNVLSAQQVESAAEKSLLNELSVD